MVVRLAHQARAQEAGQAKWRTIVPFSIGRVRRDVPVDAAPEHRPASRGAPLRRVEGRSRVDAGGLCRTCRHFPELRSPTRARAREPHLRDGRAARDGSSSRHRRATCRAGALRGSTRTTTQAQRRVALGPGSATGQCRRAANAATSFAQAPLVISKSCVRVSVWELALRFPRRLLYDQR